MPQASTWDASLYDDKHSYVHKFGESVVDLLAPQPGERILDLGCGTGPLTDRIAQAGAEVVGLDASAEMIARARANYPHLTFVQANGADFAFDQPFDAVFSNAALHWVKPPEGAVRCIWQALKPGGRLAAEFGGQGNVAVVMQAVFAAFESLGQPVPAHPWYFPSPGQYATLLEAQGFRVRALFHFDRPTPLEGDEGLRNFIRMYTPQYLDMIPVEQHERFFHMLEDTCRPAYWQDGVWVMDYVRLRVFAVRG